VTAGVVATGARPVAPRRAMSMAVPLLVAIAAGIIGSNTGFILYGALWGVITAAGILLAVRMGKIALDLLDGVLLVVGLGLSTYLATRVLPEAPPALDVLLSLRFAAAWIPAAIASAVVVRRHGARPTTVFNTAIMWVLGGAFAPGVAEVAGIMTPVDELRRGQEAIFGTGDYMILAFVVTTLGAATLLAVLAKLPALATGASLITFTLFAGAAVGFDFVTLFTALSGIPTIPNIWPPNFAWAIGDGTWWWVPSWEFGNPHVANPLVETIRIAITATVLGCAVALPVAFLASTLTAPSKVAYLTSKGFLNFIRTIPDLFWAMIFVASIGFGPFAGALALTIFTMSIMAKLLSETVDSAEPGPLEAAKAAGSLHFPAVRAAVLPQVLPNYIALALYIFELTIRASAILGIVGAGGIGQVIDSQRIFFRFDRVVAVLIPILALVIVVEQISNWARRRLV
jgi:phosphonate transport system permease protein